MTSPRRSNPRREVGDGEPAEAVDRERLTDREQLECGPLLVADVAHPLRDQVLEAIAGLERTGPAPQSVPMLQCPGFEPVQTSSRR